MARRLTNNTRARPSVREAMEGADIARLIVQAPIARPHATVAQVRRAIIGQRHGSVSHVVLVEDGGRFAGMVRDVDLMAADDELVIDKLAMTDPPVVTSSSSRDEAAWSALSRGESEVVVVDDDAIVLGIIPASALLAVTAREHADDLARLSGYLHQGDSARAASEENVMRRLWHRLPWLVVGLAGALIAAEVVATYETTLERDVMVAYFIPGLVYLSGAVGAQTVTLVIRGLSLGMPIRGIVVRELVTGLGLGLSLGVIFYPIALLLWGNAEVSLAVALSIGVACGSSNFIAIGIPWMLQQLGLDPAFGSGPLATVIQDILSILIYFAIVSAMVT